jgi:hypothetical protein
MKINLCKHCGKKFKARKGKKYCCDKCRYEAWESTASPCYYCGCAADTIDHVPPKSARPIILQLEAKRWDFVEVEACHECNSALGSRYLWTLAERKQFIKNWLKKRYARFLRSPEWSDEDKEELGYSLKDFVQKHEIVAQLAKKRIAW